MTPVGDEQASLILILSLLPGVIHRHRNRAHRIADTLVELALYVSQRRPMRSKRPAWNVILDEADRCSRRSLIKTDAYNERTSSLTEPVDVIAASWSDCDVEEQALARVQLDAYRSIVQESKYRVDLDGLLALSEQSGLNNADRQRLSRQRRRARQLLQHELGEAA